MGNMSGAVKSKGRLAVGSKVVYKRDTMYKGFQGSPEKEDRLTVKGIFQTYVQLEETPHIRYDLDDFFHYFNQIGD